MGVGIGLQQIVLEWLADEGQALVVWPHWALVLLFGGVGTVLLLVMFPLTAVAAAAGFLLGPAAGTAVTLLAVLLATEAGRRLSGSFIRERALGSMGAGPRWQAAEQGLRERSWVLAICLRLAPLIPFGVGCWLLPVVRWHRLPYVLGSAIGALPIVAFSAWMGAQAAAMIDRAEVADEVEALHRAVLFACYAAMFVGIWVAAQAIRRGIGRWRLERADPAPPQ